MSDVKKLDFVIVGAQKAGTSALFQFLSEHPDIYMPPSKELHFFDAEKRPWENTRYAQLHALLQGRAPWQIAGEATPIYMYWPTVPARLHRYNPSLRLIVMLRHPASRAYSAWTMMRAAGEETLSFAEAIRGGRRRLAVNPEMPGFHRQFSYVERGLYGHQIERLLALFPRDQILFLRLQDLRDRHADTMALACDFLGVSAFPQVPQPRRIAPMIDPKAEPMTRADKDLLMDTFAGDIARTAQLSRLDLSDWLNWA